MSPGLNNPHPRRPRRAGAGATLPPGNISSPSRVMKRVHASIEGRKFGISILMAKARDSAKKLKSMP